MRLAALLVVTGCWGGGATYLGGERWDEADALFHQDPQWLGGDGAYSIALDDRRTLWLFGDSFIATSSNRTRRESKVVRNSVAVMTGVFPLAASMEHAWDRANVGAFFPDAGDHWFWPQGGFRVPGGGPLVIFLAEVRPEPGDVFGYAIVGTRAVRIVDPDGPPSTWVIEPLALPMPAFAPDALLATCVTTIDDHLVGVSVDDRNGRLVRWPIAGLAAGDLAAREWWVDGAWVPEPALAKNPGVVFDDASSECSFSYDEMWGEYLYIESRGFGRTNIAYRRSLEFGEHYSDPGDAFDPTEQVMRTNAFTYAGKAHPSIAGDHSIVATYVDNSFRFEDLLDPRLEHTLYWPHFVRLDHLEAVE